VLRAGGGQMIGLRRGWAGVGVLVALVFPNSDWNSLYLLDGGVNYILK